MIKKLILKIIGKNLAEKWNIQDDQKVPAPGETVVSVPWYRSKAKLGFLVYIAAVILKCGPPAFGKPAVEIPREALDFLEAMGIGVGAYGLRDAIKQPAPAATPQAND